MTTIPNEDAAVEAAADAIWLNLCGDIRQTEEDRRVYLDTARAALRSAYPIIAGEGVAAEKIAHVAQYLAGMIAEWDVGAARSGPLPASIIEKSLTRFFGSALAAPPPQPEVAGLVEALKTALAKAEYQPGDHPVIPVKIAAFMDEVRAALASMDRRG
jgi:hypothetical protein